MASPLELSALQVSSFQYSAPTCILRMTGDLSPLSQVSGQPVLKRLRFDLHILTLQGSSLIHLQGMRTQLLALSHAVQTYTQQHLSQHPVSSAPMQGAINGVPSAALAQLLPLSQGEIRLHPLSLTQHRLQLGSLAPRRGPAEIGLSTLQLADLTDVLDQMEQTVSILPGDPLARPRFLSRSLAWAGTAAAVLVVVVGVGTLLPERLNRNLSTQSSSEMEVGNDTSISQGTGPADPNRKGEGYWGTEARRSPADPNSPSPNSPSPDASSPQPAGIATTPPSPQGSVASPSPAVELPSPGQTQPSHATQPGTAASPSQSASPLPSPSEDRNPSDSSTLAGAPATPPETSPGAAAPAETTTPSSETTATRETPSHTAGSATPATVAPPVPGNATHPEEHPADTTLTPGSDHAEPFGLADLPPWAETFQASLQEQWQPPADLTRPLVYHIVITQDGILARVMPQTDLAQQYQDDLPIPDLGEAIAPPGATGQTWEVTFLPSGEVTLIPL